MRRDREEMIHDMNSSLAALKGALNIMAKGKDDPDYADIVMLAGKKIDYMEKIWREVKEELKKELD